MRNPFQYGGVVTGDSFCNRIEEQRDLERAAGNCERLFLYSERRLGKTSLVTRVLSRLPSDRFLPVYIDLWPTDSVLSCITLIAKSLSEALPDPAGKLLEFTKRFFSRLRPSVALNDEGRPVVSFGLSDTKPAEPDIDEVVSAPERIAVERKKTVVVVFDEFQHILEYGDDTFERKLRSTVQTHEHVCYLFLGSRKHLIRRMFLDESRPLYRSAGHYPLLPIAEESWKPYIRERFEPAGKEITDEAIHGLYELTQGHPFYVQHLAHILWERCEPGVAVRGDALDAAVTLLLQREQYAFSTLWESLTVAQRRFLAGLAEEGASARVFSAEFLGRYSLASSSTVQRVVESLLLRDIIDRENGGYVITDRFFRIWIRRLERRG